MPTITFQPSGKKISVPAGTVLIDALRQAGMKVDLPCGGEGVCGRCIVRIVSGGVDHKSSERLTKTAIENGFGLACRTRILDSHVTVDVPDRFDRQGGKFDDTSLINPKSFIKEIDPITSKVCVKVSKPMLEDGLSDLDRLTRSLAKGSSLDIDIANDPFAMSMSRLDPFAIPFVYPLSVIQSVAQTLREDNGSVTVTLSREQERYRCICIEPGKISGRHYGAAIDIGTTTVAVQLVDLTDAGIVGTMTAYNGQIDCGLDVISRINYAKRSGCLEELRGLILKTINDLIEQLTKSHELSSDDIFSAVISGNTTMVHLLLGLKPEYIRLEPYTPTVLESPFVTAKEVGIKIAAEASVYISPAKGSYVGGDITAGILCSDLAANTKDVNLFIDIGTNGELVLGSSDFLIACACSAGPAFEGGGIKHGMRAAAGAIEDVVVDRETGIAGYSTIGNVEPKGICGSGMISLLASLFQTGWIDPAGKLNRTKRSEAITIVGRRAFYKIDKSIIVSETDFENIIRAKAAIYSASSLLLEKVGMKFDDLAHIYIAGGFGRFLDLYKAKVIGLIPDLPEEKFRFIGNSSLMGSYMILVSEKHRRLQLELAKRMTYIELNTSPDYMNQYTSALFLPHTERERFPSVSVLC